MSRSILLFVLTSLFGSAGPASAAIFCVTDSAELQEALDLAEVNGEDDSVHVAAGLYPVPMNGTIGFLYDAASPVNGDDLAIAITGGWSVGDSCAQQSPDASLTVLDGGGTSQVMRIFPRPSGNLTLQYLTFANGAAPEFQRGGGLTVPNVPGYAATIRIESNRFIGNTADYAGGLAVGIDAAPDARVFVTNNLLAFNHAREVNSAIELGIGTGHAYVTNNTVLFNTEDAGLARAVDIFGAGEFLIANNNLWGNQGSDLHLRTTEVELLHNNIGVRTGDEPVNESGNISVEPVHEEGAIGFTPVRNSPLVDAGIASAEPWSLTEFDLNGAPRVVGPAVDIGAYENERIFLGDFEEPIAFAADDPAATACIADDCAFEAFGERP